MMKQALRVAFGFLILWASVLHAEVRIVIDSGVDSGRPIGVVPFQWAGPGAAPEDIGGIVAADLRNSGKFNPLDRARLPQQPPDKTQYFIIDHLTTPVLACRLSSRGRLLKVIATGFQAAWAEACKFEH